MDENVLSELLEAFSQKGYMNDVIDYLDNSNIKILICTNSNLNFEQYQQIIGNYNGSFNEEQTLLINFN